MCGLPPEAYFPLPTSLPLRIMSSDNGVRIFFMLCVTLMALLPTISINSAGLSTMDISRITLHPSAANNVSEVRVSNCIPYLIEHNSLTHLNYQFGVW